MRNVWIVVFALVMCVAFAACSDSSDEGNSEARDRIDSIELASVEKGVAYWDVVLKEDVDWASLGMETQAETAVEAIVECVGREETPSADLCQVEGYQGADGSSAFLWSVKQSDRVLLKNREGAEAIDYILTKEELNRILGAKGFKLTEEWD